MIPALPPPVPMGEHVIIWVVAGLYILRDVIGLLARLAGLHTHENP